MWARGSLQCRARCVSEGHRSLVSLHGWASRLLAAQRRDDLKGKGPDLRHWLAALRTIATLHKSECAAQQRGFNTYCTALRHAHEAGAMAKQAGNASGPAKQWHDMPGVHADALCDSDLTLKVSINHHKLIINHQKPIVASITRGIRSAQALCPRRLPRC